MAVEAGRLSDSSESSGVNDGFDLRCEGEANCRMT